MRLELGFWADRWFFFGASVGKLDDSTVLFTSFLCANGWLILQTFIFCLPKELSPSP
jgi:hypothetical protein